MNRLTDAQHFKLCKWLEEQREQMTGRSIKPSTLARRAQRDLGFRVTENNIVRGEKSLSKMAKAKEVEIGDGPEDPDDNANLVKRVSRLESVIEEGCLLNDIYGQTLWLADALLQVAKYAGRSRTIMDTLTMAVGDMMKELGINYDYFQSLSQDLQDKHLKYANDYQKRLELAPKNLSEFYAHKWVDDHTPPCEISVDAFREIREMIYGTHQILRARFNLGYLDEQESKEES